MINMIESLVGVAPRQILGEQQACEIIKGVLYAYDIHFTVQRFQAIVPQMEKALLYADGKKIKCKSTSFVSGKITGKDFLISSLTPSVKFRFNSNINFNPLCDAISCANFYFAPSVAISRKDVNKILRAKEVKGEVRVKPTEYLAQNILVGNTKNPEKIFFVHYDSLGPGAIDNASAVGVLMKIILENPQNSSNLYVFAAQKELSYDRDLSYYGKGFRVFEEEYSDILENAKELIVVDCVGYSDPILSDDKKILQTCLTFKNFERLAGKSKVITGDYEKLMRIYHSDLDDGRFLKQKYLDKTYLFLEKFLKNNL